MIIIVVIKLFMWFDPDIFHLAIVFQRAEMESLRAGWRHRKCERGERNVIRASGRRRAGICTSHAMESCVYPLT